MAYASFAWEDPLRPRPSLFRPAPLGAAEIFFCRVHSGSCDLAGSFFLRFLRLRFPPWSPPSLSSESSESLIYCGDGSLVFERGAIHTSGSEMILWTKRTYAERTA